MITRVRLSNWKAYDELDVQLTEGTTFLVAPNGVGKSSFLEAVRWALNPDAAPTATAMRRLATVTTVIVDLRVDDVDVVISRTLTRTTGSLPELTSAAMTGGDETPIADALEWVATKWSADPRFLHRCAFLTDRLLLEEGEPDLEDHLVRLYSLDSLRRSQTAAKAEAAKFEAEARGAKKQSRASTTQLTAAEAALAELEASAATTANEASSAHDTAVAASEALTAAQAVIEVRERHDRWEVRNAALISEVTDLLGEPAPGMSLGEFLRTAEAGARAQLVHDTELRATLAERLLSVESALTRLLHAEGECPLCRQPLDTNSRQHAEAAHLADRDRATAELANLDPESSHNVTADIARLHQTLHELGDRPTLPDEPEPDLMSLKAAEEAARLSAATAATAAEQAKVDVGVAQQRLTDLRESAVAPDAVRLFEQAALLTACAEALHDGIAQVLERQIGPLSDQVNRRWEALFPDRAGLSLDRTGRLARVYDDDGDPLPFEAFSSGEKVIAKILMRLTTLSATTDIPFIWIDEPLEHLDPIARVFVAETLALLTSVDDIAQIVVTTYEDELARRLEGQEDHPVRLRMLRNAPLSA